MSRLFHRKAGQVVSVDKLKKLTPPIEVTDDEQ